MSRVRSFSSVAISRRWSPWTLACRRIETRSPKASRCLERLLEIDPAVKVIVLTGQNDQSNALRAVRMGPMTSWPSRWTRRLEFHRRARLPPLFELQQENRRLQMQQSSDVLGGLITRDPGMQKLCRMIEKVAPSDATVLLLGESGTGKEVLAQGLHDASKRKGRFVAINCAAIPENLLESELFGYERAPSPAPPRPPSARSGPPAAAP